MIGKTKNNLIYAACLIIFSATFPALAQDRMLKIGMAGSAPFTMHKGKQIHGITAEIWKELGFEAKMHFDFVRYDNIEQMLQAVQKGDIDFAAGPITITAQRLEQVAFTQPYYRSTKAILAYQDSASIWNTIKPFLRTTFLWGVFSLIVVLFLVGNLIWLAERKKNPIFAKQYLPGVGNGMWFAIVTFTTVGYGDLTPLTRAGRMLTATWMIIALITASSMTAGIATSFTLIRLKESSIDSPKSLTDQKVAAIQGTTGMIFAKKFQANIVPVKSIPEAVTLLREKKVIAIVSDFPILKHYKNKNKDMDWKILPIQNEQDYYGFCTRYDHPDYRKINLALIQAMEKGKIHRILQRWELL